MRQGDLILAAGRVRSKNEKYSGVEKNTESCRAQNTPRSSQQPGDRDRLETACDETRPMR